MLYRLHSNIFIISILTFGFISALAMQKAITVMAMVSFLSLVTHLALMLYYSQEDRADYSERALFFTTLSYTIALGVFYIFVSEFYDGDTFLFSKMDAIYYYKQSTRVFDVGLEKNLGRIIQNVSFEDWGALVFDTVALYLIPSKLFVNFINTLSGAVATVFLYRMNKPFMPKPYAFLAALAYGTSSYMVFFHCSFLKESMFVFFVISSFYNHYQFVRTQSRSSFFWMAFCVGMLFFYRPAVAVFLAVSLFSYYGIISKGKAISVFLYVAVVILGVMAMSIIQDSIESNTLGGDMDAVIADTSNKSYSSGFNYFVSFFGALFGPFPSLLQRFEDPTYVEFLGAGLTYKLFIIGSFWYGVFCVIKDKVIELIPLVIFVVLEMLATAYVCASLELRKVLLHMPFMYALAFYGIYKGMNLTQLTRVSSFPCYMFTIAVIFLWNVIKVKT